MSVRGELSCSLLYAFNDKSTAKRTSMVYDYKNSFIIDIQKDSCSYEK